MRSLRSPWRCLPGDPRFAAGTSAVAAAFLLIASSSIHLAAATDSRAPDSQTDIVLPRFPAPSPDGSQIAFSYQGDLWIVSSAGGEARRLTANEAYDGRPVWSPDGHWIAFASDREGNDDVYVMPVDGGKVRRLTWHNDNDYPIDWTPDSRAVIFQSRRHIRDNGSWGMFLVPLEGGTPFPIVATGARAGTLSPDGRKLAYVRGIGPWPRRGYEGSARGRLWLCELESPLLAAGDWPWVNGRTPSAAEDALGCTSAALLSGAALRTAQHVNLAELGADAPPPPYDQPERNWLQNWDRGPDFSRPNVETGCNSLPQWFPDCEHLSYLSESGGVCNLKLMSAVTGGRHWLTHYTDGRLRYPSLARNGRLIAYEYEDGIYTLAIPAELPRASNPAGESEWAAQLEEPQCLHIQMPIDERVEQIERRQVTSGATELAVAPDGDQIAFVYGGDIFAMLAGKDETSAYRLTDSPGSDASITWLPDSKGLVFTSDRSGNRDIYRLESADPGEPRVARALRFKITPLTKDETDEWAPKVSPNGKWIAYLSGAGTLMLMAADGSDQRTVLENRLEIEFTWSPDSRWVMYAVEDNDYNSDVWIVSVDGKIGPHNISQHPKDDFHPVWSPDGRMVAFASSREFLNQIDIWYVWLTRADEERSREARLEEFGASKKPAAEGETADPWQANGDSGAGKPEKQTKPAAKTPAEVRIDFDDIHKRLHRLTTFPGTESNVLISENGSEFVFVSDTDGQSDLWKVKWDGTEPTRLTTGGQKPREAQWDPKLKEIYFLNRAGTIAAVPLQGGQIANHPYSAFISVDLAAQRAAAFDEAWRLIRDNFYDANMHGCDWAAARDHYRPWAIAASTRRDFQDVVRMMLGELNGSHLGISGGTDEFSFDPGGDDYEFALQPARGESGRISDSGSEGGNGTLPVKTGELGVLFDPAYHGSGLRILHVVKGTAAERVSCGLKPGDVILAVNSASVTADHDFSQTMDGTVGQRTLLDVIGSDGASRAVVIEPDSSGTFRRKLYEEEIDLRRAYVNERSGGKVAYVHIENMGTRSLDTYERDLYAEAAGRKSLIIDVRENGGGWTTDLLLTSLMAGDHAITSSHGSAPGYPEERRLLYAWTNPAVVLCNENSFSNAEIFTWAMRTLHRAPVVGQRTFGGVISTGGTTLVDGSWLRLPTRGWWSKLDGSPEEGTGCMPDYTVENNPNDVARGVDRQLETALDLALEQIR